MAEDSNGNQSLIPVWESELLRLTAFPSPATRIVEPNWWERVVGEPAETRTSRPRERLGLQEEGKLEDRYLVLTIQPDRIDWVLTPVVDRRETEEFLTMGPFLVTVEAFLNLMLSWLRLDDCPSLVRLAFGAVLLQPTNSLDRGYRKLLEYLPKVEIDLVGASNFFYQINRRRTSNSGIDGLDVNRLSKWSVQARQGLRLAVGETLVKYKTQEKRFACRLELDINTAPEFEGELVQEKLPEIFQELVNLGREISEKGDIP
ncbi:hypothetical protein MYX78_06310 [Acidobacteria bacterium AH-259-G07]|nr:hypothetical protein [Acidobacteria bacterium AH-259-G07]